MQKSTPAHSDPSPADFASRDPGPSTDSTPSQTPRTAPVADGCPRWAADLILRICELEIKLGNIKPAGDWQVNTVGDILSRLSADDEGFEAGVVDALFQKVARELHAEGFASDDIAAFVNCRIPSGRLPYCNAAEVDEVIG